VPNLKVFADQQRTFDTLKVLPSSQRRKYMENQIWFNSKETGKFFNKPAYQIVRAIKRSEFTNVKKVGKNWYIHRSEIYPNET